MSVTDVLTADSSPPLPPPGMKLYEVVDGQFVEKEPMGAYECIFASVLAGYLQAFVWKHDLGEVATETLFWLDASIDLKHRPDVAFLAYDRWPETSVPHEEAWDAVPDLAIEVVSPTNTATRIDDKVVEYFQAGVRVVWVIHPESGRTYVHKSPTTVHVVERSGHLEGGEVLPGFRLAVEDIYKRLSKPS